MSARCAECGAELSAPGASCMACLFDLATRDAVQVEARLEADASTLEAETRLGSAIGRYELESILGEGGMGVVYLARQAEPIARRVALKVIKIGMDSREVLKRFDLERRTLALLDHPNIARVIDAGATAGGRPYFVMEHVDGVPITDYCDARRLGVDERIELFLAVCDGIQHAHFKGIVHRDLKPGNVLVAEVDGRPVPKVIDFGLAKATERRNAETTAFTRLGRLIGTPEYMSPEQAGLAARDVDSRTDIYSLGILFYEMLAGAPPLEGKVLRQAGLEELLRQIRNAPSPCPSIRVVSLGEEGADIASNRRTDRAALVRRLEGDLDWVVMKAIEKDRDRRYATVQELAAELRRYLKHEPVEAGPPGRLYRLGKFVRRHRLGFVAASAVLAALLLGTIGTSVGWLRASRAERRATEEAAAAEQVSAFLTDLFEVSKPANQPAETITAPHILAQGAARIRTELAGQPLIQARMMLTISGVYRNLDLHDEALVLAEEALEIRRRELPDGDLEIGDALLELGTVQLELGQLEGAQWNLEAAMAVLDRNVDADDPRRIPGLRSLGRLFVRSERFQEAYEPARRALELGERALDAGSPDLALLYQDLGAVLLALGRLDEAETLLTGALDDLRRELGDDHVLWANTASKLGQVLQRQNRLDEAIALYKQVVTVHERNYGPVHTELASSTNSLAVCYAMQGRYEEAAPLFISRVGMLEQLFGPEHVDVGRALINVGNIQRDLGDYPAAERAYLKAAAILRRELGETEALALDYGNLAGLYGRLGRDEESLELHRRALAIREKTHGPEHARTAMSMDNVAATLRDMGRRAEAEPLFLRALAIREKTLPANHPYIAKSLHGLGVLYREQGRYEESRRMLERAIQIRSSALGPDHPQLALSLSALAVLCRDQGDTDEADELFRRALGIMEAKYETDHPQMREMLEEYATLLRDAGRSDEAARLEERARAIGGDIARHDERAPASKQEVNR
jgi:non-specific serine/threonine protein kinase/serine/threonine-protein kinase